MTSRTKSTKLSLFVELIFRIFAQILKLHNLKSFWNLILEMIVFKKNITFVVKEREVEMTWNVLIC
jgi:hypothetical protein